MGLSGPLINKLPSDGRAYMADGASNELAKWDFEWLDHHMSVFVGKHLLSSHDTMFSHMQASNKPWSSKGVFGKGNVVPEFPAEQSR